MGRIANNVDYLYLCMCKDLLHAPKIGGDAAADRINTGGTRELNNVKLVLTDITNNIVSIRGISPSYLFAELLWYFNGRRDLEFISKFSSAWTGLSDDGETCNSAYGYLMKYAFDFDQIEKVIELLKKDPTSRRAKININTPNEYVIETKDEPCTMFLQFLIRNGKLHCTTVMRSNDIWFGFPYDMAFFTELQKYIADKLNVNYGTYTHFVVSMHMYERDYDKIHKIVKQPIVKTIDFDRKLFHNRCSYIADKIAASDENPKKLLMELLKQNDIYKE